MFYKRLRFRFRFWFRFRFAFVCFGWKNSGTTMKPEVKEIGCWKEKNCGVRSVWGVTAVALRN
jgi:hypothetical protein